MDEWAKILKLKPCPFCGEIPRALMFEQDRFGERRLVLECCMKHEITQDAPETITSWSGAKKSLRIDMTPEEKWNRRTSTARTAKEEEDGPDQTAGCN